MADTKISQLPAVVAVSGTDEFPVNQAFSSKKETVSQLQSFLSTGSFTGSMVGVVRADTLTQSNAGTGFHNEGYTEWHELPSTPITPDSSHARIYAADFHGFSTLNMLDSQGLITHVGQDVMFTVRNNGNSTILKGTAVHITGAQAGAATVVLAIASSSANMPADGIAVQDIAVNQYGRVMLHGELPGINTQAYLEGDTLFVSPTTAGALTKVQPTFPNISQQIGTVLTATNNGTIRVNAQAFDRTTVGGSFAISGSLVVLGSSSLGQVTGTFFKGDGSQLSNITAVTAAYAILADAVHSDIAFLAHTFPGATTEAKISAANLAASASAQSGSADSGSNRAFVWVRESMLPYEADRVTFYPKVHVVREGQDDWTEYDVRAYGAHGNGIHDDYSSFKAIYAGVFRGITHNTGSGLTGRVHWPFGYYRNGRPIEYCETVETVAEGRGVNFGSDYEEGENNFLYSGIGASILANLNPSELFSGSNYIYGPIMYGIGPYVSGGVGGGKNPLVLPMTAPLATGGGASFNFSDTGSFLNLSIAKTTHIDGLSQLTVRCFIKPSGSIDGAIVGSGGDIMYGATGVGYQGKPMACFLGIRNGKFAGAMTVNNALKEVSSSITPVSGTLYHVEMGFNGTNLYLFVSGTLAMSASAVGTINQGNYEDFLFPALQSVGPDGIGPMFYGQAGGASIIYSLDIENVCLHSASFACPTARHEFDAAHTLLLLNGDDQEGAHLTFGRTINGNAWLPLQMNTSQYTDGLGLAIFRNTSILDPLTQNSIPFLSPYTWGTFILDGVYFSGYYGLKLLYHNDGGVQIINGASLTGGATAIQVTQTNTTFFVTGYGGLVIERGIFLQSGRDNIITDKISCEGVTMRNFPHGFYFFGKSCHSIVLTTPISSSNFSIVDTTFGDETLAQPDTTADWRSTIAVTAGSSGSVNGRISGHVRSNGGSKSVLRVDGARVNVTIDDLSLNGNGSGSALIDYLTPPARPIHVKNVEYQTNWIPLSTTGGLAILSEVGVGTPITGAASATFDAYTHDTFDVFLTQSVSASTILHATPRQRITFRIRQDATGSRTFAYDPRVKGGAAVSQQPNAVTQQIFEAGIGGNFYPLSLGITDSGSLTGLTITGSFNVTGSSISVGPSFSVLTSPIGGNLIVNRPGTNAGIRITPATLSNSTTIDTFGGDDLQFGPNAIMLSLIGSTAIGSRTQDLQIFLNNSLGAGGTVARFKQSTDGDLVLGINDIGGGQRLRVSGSGHFSNALQVDNSASFNGLVSASSISGSGNLFIGGAANSSILGTVSIGTQFAQGGTLLMLGGTGVISLPATAGAAVNILNQGIGFIYQPTGAPNYLGLGSTATQTPYPGGYWIEVGNNVKPNIISQFPPGGGFSQAAINIVASGNLAPSDLLVKFFTTGNIARAWIDGAGGSFWSGSVTASVGATVGSTDFASANALLRVAGGIKIPTGSALIWGTPGVDFANIFDSASGDLIINPNGGNDGASVKINSGRVGTGLTVQIGTPASQSVTGKLNVTNDLGQSKTIAYFKGEASQSNDSIRVANFNDVTLFKVTNSGSGQFVGSLTASNSTISGTLQNPFFDNGTVSASFVVDWSSGSTQMVTLAAAGSTASFANMKDGQTLFLQVFQDNAGSRTITKWDATTAFPVSGSGFPAPSTGSASGSFSTVATAMDEFRFLYNGRKNRSYGIQLSKGSF